MKKVYILINHFQVQDGVARTAVSLANELSKRDDVEVTLQSLFSFDRKMLSNLSSKVKAKPFLNFYFRGLARLVDLIPDRLLYKLLIREKYDVEIGYCMTLPIKIIAESTNEDAIHYAWIHGYDTGLTLRSSYEKMDRVITVSRENAEHFSRDTNGSIPVSCCHNLMDDARICEMGSETVNIQNSNCVTFVTVGRLEYGKGVHRLIESLGKLKKERYCFRLLLIGDGEQRSQLESLTKQLELEEEVLFLGSQSNPYAYVAKSDLLICPSYSEGYSTVCAEAILLNVPVLTTSVGGAKEIIEDARAGMMVGMEDSDLYDGIKRILDAPELINEWKDTLKDTKSVFSYKNRAIEFKKALDI